MPDNSALNLPARVRYGDEVVSTLRERARASSFAPDLREELAIARELLTDSIEAYDHAVQEAIAKGLDLHRVKIAAGGVVAIALERIERMAYTQSRISSAKFMAMPDVSQLIDGVIGTIDTELAQHAGQLRMTGLDPKMFMDTVAEKLRAMQQAGAPAMAQFGPSGRNAVEEANAEARQMDDTVPECSIEVASDADDADAA